MSHARFSPSSSKRWLTCTASMSFPEVESKESTFATRGTACHEASESLLAGHKLKESYVGYTLGEDDIESVIKPYVEYVRNLDADIFLYEQKVEICKDCYGTADCIAFNTKTSTLHIVDLKAGQLRVDVEDNTQLQIYAIGAVNYFRRTLGHKIKEVFVHIFQPMINNISYAQVDLNELKDLRRQVIDTINDIHKENYKFEASEDACRWCDHKVNCPKLKELVLKTASTDFENSELSEKMKMVAPLKLWIKAIEETSLEVMNGGEKLSGFKLVRGRGSRVFKDESCIVEAFTQLDLNTNKIYTSRKLLSVAQIEKLVKKEKIKIDLSEFINKKEGAPKIVAESSPLKEINKIEETKEAFEDIPLFN